MPFVQGGSLFDSGDQYRRTRETLYILAILNSVIGQFYLDISNATINYQPGDIAGIPVVFLRAMSRHNELKNV